MSQPSRMRLYTMDDAVADYPERDYRANKYNDRQGAGHLRIRGMHGAAALCANAALRAGAGMVKLAYPAGIHAGDLRAHPGDHRRAHRRGLRRRGRRQGRAISARHHWRKLESLIEWADCVLMGPGLGKHPETRPSSKA